MNFNRRFSFFALFLLILVTSISGVALARAGGGQSYGGGGSGSSGGGGDGFGIIIYLLIRLCIEQPCIGIPLVIIIIVVSIIMKKKQVKKQYSTIQQAGNRNLNQNQDAVAMNNSLLNLKARDTNFTTENFAEKAKKAFLEIQQAWSDQNLSAVGRFISDGVRERFSLQIHMQRSQGIRNKMDAVQVLGADIIAIESDRHFDSIHVKITARADDSDVDLETGRTLRNNYSGTFVEYWTFLRKPGVQTLEGKGLVEGVCPNCSAPLKVSESGHCEFCDAVVTSGEYDWVLTEITQSVEWSTASSPARIPGYTQLSQADPGFNVQALEDTASVIFWRYIKSYFDGSSEPLRKVATDECADAIDTAIKNTVDGHSHLYFQDAAVGTVEIQSIETGSEMDRVNVLVKWSAKNAWLDSGGKSGSSGPKTIRPQIFELVRMRGVKTLASMGLHSAHCTGCGAPYTGGESGSCQYCGRPLNDGSGSWVLQSVKPFSGSRINSSAVSPVSGTSGVTADILLMAMTGVMYSDGQIDGEEMELLKTFAGQRGVSEEDLQTIITSVTQPGSDLPRPKDTGEAMEVLRAMVRMSLADGELSDPEKAMLEKYALSAGLSKNVVSSTISAQRRNLYKEAKKSGK